MKFVHIETDFICIDYRTVQLSTYRPSTEGEEEEWRADRIPTRVFSSRGSNYSSWSSIELATEDQRTMSTGEAR